MDTKSKRNSRAETMPWFGCILPGLFLAVPLAQQQADMRGFGSPESIRGFWMALLLLPGVLSMVFLARRRPYTGRLWYLESMLLLPVLWQCLYGKGSRAILGIVMYGKGEELLSSYAEYYVPGNGSIMINGGTLLILYLALCLLPLSYGLSLCLYQLIQIGRRGAFRQQSLAYRWGYRLYGVLAGGKTLRRQALGMIGATVLLFGLAVAAMTVGLIWFVGAELAYGEEWMLILLAAALCLGAGMMGLLLAAGFCRRKGLFGQTEALQRRIGQLAEGGLSCEEEKDAALHPASERTTEDTGREEAPPVSSPLYPSFEQLGHISETLKESIRQAVAGERLKVELLANVSHDLKTPLTAIIGYGERLAKEELPQTAREYVERLNHKAAYLYDVVQDVFELSKVSSGSIGMEMTALDVKKLWEQTIGGMDGELRQSSVTLRRRYEGEDFRIRGDGARLHRVFQNLLDNALKYSLTGSRIYLTVTGLSAGPTAMAGVLEAPVVTVTMVNTASYEINFDAKTITGRFVRGDQARTGEGSGLGLAIASTFVQACSGTLEVDTDYDQFRVRITFPFLSD